MRRTATTPRRICATRFTTHQDGQDMCRFATVPRSHCATRSSTPLEG